MVRKVDLSITKTRVGVTFPEGDNGSTMCYVTEVEVPLTGEIKSIAFDGYRWFVQRKKNGWFKYVDEIHVPQEVKDRIAAFQRAAKS